LLVNYIYCAQNSIVFSFGGTIINLMPLQKSTTGMKLTRQLLGGSNFLVGNSLFSPLVFLAFQIYLQYCIVYDT